MDKRGTDATPRGDLGAVLMEYDGTNAGFISSLVLPVFKTQLQKSTFPKITRESMTQDADAKRGSKGNYNRVNFFTEDGDYSCQEFGLEGPLDDKQRNLFETQFDAELTTVEGINHLLLIQQEKRAAALCFNTSTFTGSSLYTDNSSAPWDNIASDVISQVKAAVKKVRDNTGVQPNALVISKTNLDRLTANTGIKDAIKYTTKLTLAEIEAALAPIFGIARIIVGNGIVNSSKKIDTFSASDIWSDDYALVAKLITNPNSFAEPGLGRSFLWVKDTPENTTVEEYRDEPVRSDVFRVRQNIDEVLCDAYFGHLMKVDS